MSDLSSPPPNAVPWVIRERYTPHGPTWHAVAQTAHKAWQLSGCPLHYSQVEVKLAAVTHTTDNGAGDARRRGSAEGCSSARLSTVEPGRREAPLPGNLKRLNGHGGKR